jgi:type II secretory pathway pseudopilin PulG
MINRKNSERGETLVEVVVAAVIMGLLGVTIVGSIVATQPLAQRVNITGNAMANLNSAAEQIQLQNFQACSPTNPQPYSLSANAVQIPAVAGGSSTITTNALPIGQAPAAGLSHAYSATLTAVGGAGSYSWSVTPRLPTGLSLDSAGLISGTPSAESSAEYSFTATSGSLSVSKSIVLTIVTISVQVNSASITWTPCQSVAVAAITGASANGSTFTYTYSGAITFAAGDSVTISGTTPTTFNLISVPVISATSSQFVVANTGAGAYVSGGLAGLTKSVNVQQITVTTTSGGHQITRIIVAAV